MDNNHLAPTGKGVPEHEDVGLLTLTAEGPLFIYAGAVMHADIIDCRNE